MNPLYVRQLGIQLAATGLAAGVVWGLALPALFAVLQPLLAVSFAVLKHAPRWWWGLHAAFVPALLLTLAYPIAPYWYLLAFLLVFASSSNALRERVPLFLSSRAVIAVLADRLPQGAKVVDLGCGTGRMVCALAVARPDLQIDGVESAWLPYWIARCQVRLRRLARTQIIFGDLWQHALTPYQVVYVYLSPEPMTQVWAKFRQQAVAGAWLVSNSFEIEGVAPEETVQIDDVTASRLMIWRQTPLHEATTAIPHTTAQQKG